MSNQQLLDKVNSKLKGELEDKELRKLPTRLIDRQITLYAHIIRAEEDDPMKMISITEQGEKTKKQISEEQGDQELSGTIQLEDTSLRSLGKKEL